MALTLVLTLAFDGALAILNPQRVEINFFVNHLSMLARPQTLPTLGGALSGSNSLDFE